MTARFFWISIVLASALAACASAPPAAPVARSPTQRQSLTALGFVEQADGWDLNLAGRVQFGLDETTLTPAGVTTLEKVAKVLLGVGIDHITVEGHADSSGSSEHNQRLSERRAETVAATLVANGFAVANIERRAYGASRPVADNATEAGRLLNRRAVLIVASR